MNIRNSLLAIGIGFGVLESIDIPDTGIPALVFALLFFGLTAWIWRRDSRPAAALVGVLLAFEATQAQTWKDASVAVKGIAMVGGSLGLAVVGAYVLRGSARTIVPVAMAAAVAVAAALAGSAGAATQSQTLRLLTVQQSGVFSPDAAPAPGSRILFADALFNRVAQFGKPAGARIGHAEGVCTLITMGTAQCVITAHVPNGQLVLVGSMRLTRGLATNHLAIVGGAGAYGSARGTVFSRDVSQTKSLVTLTLGA
jgi:hypothetical protein